MKTLEDLIAEGWRTTRHKNYLVDEYSNVYSIPRGKILIPIIIKGRLKVRITIKGKKKSVFGYRLACRAWHGKNGNGKNQINHIDGILWNNHVSNVEWASRSQNILHRNRVLNGGTNRSNQPLHYNLKDYLTEILPYNPKIIDIINQLQSRDR